MDVDAPCVYHVTTLARQLAETVAGGAAPLPEYAVFALYHALQAVQAAPLDYVD
ncbi:hypothetical protein GGX14DRAFT_579831 [Mycena pura]|uniref:Uncharacterized protein n=1 Tax=Mycena pura TaxID=153505 RepID=A0AAD6UML1_9AGAR|nr:hypothetical protein GGX14DRAFT_579831 [Mycena pura]